MTLTFKSLHSFTAALTLVLYGSAILPTTAMADDVLSRDASSINPTAVARAPTNLDNLCRHLRESADDKFVFKGKSLKATCEAYAWGSDNETQVMCKLRDSAKNSQAIHFCEAREKATKAKKHLTAAMAVDAGAAALCLGEAFSFPTPAMNVCGIASLAAGAAETARVIQQRAGGLGKTNGGVKVDEEGVLSESKGGLVGALTNVVPAVAGYKLAMSYFHCQNKNTVNNGDVPVKDRMEANKKRNHLLQEKHLLEKQIGRMADTKVTDAVNLLNQLNDDINRSPCDRHIIALKAGIFFGGLAALRTLNRTQANKTLTSVEASLRSLLGEGQSATGAVTNNGSTTFSKTAASYGVATAGSSAITAEDLTDGSLESMYLKRTPLGEKAVQLANRAGLGNDATLDAASAGGSGSLISALSGKSDPDLAASADALKPYFASVDTGGATYGSGGGSGGSSASTAASTPLNFGALLGGEGGAAPAEGVTEEAFRGPAQATSIFHENSTHNIFQIVSGKLENLQQSARIPAQAVR